MTEEEKKEKQTTKTKIDSQLSIQDMISRGNEIYEEIKNQLEPQNNGKYVVIDVKSENYFIGETADKAVAEARKSIPENVLVVKKIGSVDKSLRHSHSHNYKHARLLRYRWES